MTKKAFSLGASALLLILFSLGESLFLARSHEATNQATGFVAACGTQLCIGNVLYYPYGASFYGSSSQSGIDNPQGLIALAQQEKLNAIRLVNFYHTGKNTDPNVTPYDPTTWAKVDALLVAAANANMKVILDNADYKNILWNHCINPWTYDWHHYLAFVANRINDMTGQVYKNDPTIFLVTFAGDLHKVPATYTFVDANGANCSISLTADMYTSFFADVESYWKTLDPNHLVSPGGVAGMEYAGQNGIPWQAIFSNPATDVCGTKTYGGMVNFLPTLANYCNNTLHKPWFDDEWGYPQSDGDSVRATKFQSQFDNNKANNAAGEFFWNAGYQMASTTYDINPQTPLTFNTIIQNAPQQLSGTPTPPGTPFLTSVPSPTLMSSPNPTMTLKPTTIPSPTLSTNLGLSNLAVYDANSSHWHLETSLQVGSAQWGDRTYQFTSIPSDLLGANWVQTAMSSKTSANNPLATFTLNRSATVYIALDTRDPLPAFMSGWSLTSLTILDNDNLTFKVYAKSFSVAATPLTIVLGAEAVSSGGHSMYTVIVK